MKTFKQHLNEANTPVVMNKVTLNLAKRNKIDLVEVEGSRKKDDNTIMFFWEEEENEPMFTYRKDEDSGDLYFKDNIWLDKSLKEELPNWINTETKLREMIKFLGKAVPSTI